MDLNRNLDDFVVLRTSAAPIQRGPMPRGVDSTGEKLEVEDRRITGNEAVELSAERDVLAVVRGCPVSLVAPVAMPTATSGESDQSHVCGESGQSHSHLGDDGVTWGVRSVGAATSPYSGRGVKVAVLDTGIDPEHPTFRGVPLTSKNFTPDTDEDVIGHGTHCAATIAGQDTDGVRIGVAPGISHLYAAKVLVSRGTSNTKYVFSGFSWALEQGVNVLSMSLGIDFPALVQHLRGLDPEADERMVLSKALNDYNETVEACAALVDYAESREHFGQTTVVVGASGNESDRREAPPTVLMASPPAAANGVLAVGAVGRSGELRPDGTDKYDVAYFSNGNATVVGPGVDVLSARAGGEGLVAHSGTSMATPHVAGVAALWMEELTKRQPKFKVEDVRARVLGRCETERFVSSVDQAAIGNGLVQAPQA